jgi:GNAT superfamily N-acetyltransferase
MDKVCKIHLNTNVGLNRMGIAPSRLTKVARKTKEKPHLLLDGIYAQPRDHRSALSCYQRLLELQDQLHKKDIAPKNLHFANSTTFLSYPQMAETGARLGILAYGVLPPEHYGEKQSPFPLEPVMQLTTTVVQIRELPKGSRIGYRAKCRTDRDSTIATLPMGYAHGLDRKLEKKGYVLLKGCRAPFIGAISMNSSTIDVTDISGIRIGDEATVIGNHGNQVVTVNDLAAMSGTIAAELMVRFGRGIARKYITKISRSITRSVPIKKGTCDGFRILNITSESDHPGWLHVVDIARFLQHHLSPPEEAYENIYEAVNYVVSRDPSGEGMLIVALDKTRILGVVVCARVDAPGSPGQNMLVYFCVHRDHRRRGIGTLLMKEVMAHSDGRITVNVKPDNPCIGFLEKFDFQNHRVQMRLDEGGQRWIPSRRSTRRIGSSGTTVQKSMKGRS